MRNLIGIRPQDVVLMMKLLSEPSLAQMELSNKLHLSQSEISHGLKRLKGSGLVNLSGRVIQEASIEFFVHAIKYIYPPQLGAPALGIPTAYAHPDFEFVRHQSEAPCVWPYSEGKIRGPSLLPIYKSLPQACLEDKLLYKIASLVEMIRMGRAREKQLAAESLSELIKDIND